MPNAIPAKLLDYDAWAQGFFGPIIDGVRIDIEQPDKQPPYRTIVQTVFPQQRATPVSRYVRLAYDIWDVGSQHQGDLAAAKDLAIKLVARVESLSGSGPLIHAELETGPTRQVDPDSRVEYVEITFLLVVAT